VLDQFTHRIHAQRFGRQQLGVWLGPDGLEQRAARYRFMGPRRQQHEHSQPLHAPNEEVRPRERRNVSPMQVIDHKGESMPGREIDGEPVQAMKRRWHISDPL
jgi:hypothetical protein